MHKLILTLSTLATLGMAANAGTISLTTSAEPGTKVRILPNVASVNSPIYIDYGNGVEVPYTVDPSMAAYNRWIEGTIEGEMITIRGNLTELEFSEAKLTSATVEGMNKLQKLELQKNELNSFTLVDVTPLTHLDLSHNNIFNSPTSNPTLSLEYAGETLTNLNISYNTSLQCLKINDLTALEYLTANDCPDLGSVFICLPEESRPSIININLSNCDIAHFYPVSLPNMTTLNLANNNLMTVADTDPFVLGNYPKLHNLDVSGNIAVRTLNVTGCKELESLSVKGNRMSTIDISQAPALTSLNVSETEIESLDLGNNTQLTSLYAASTPIKAIDFRKLPSIRNIDISNTNISRVDLHDAFYLQSFAARNTKLEFVDFNGCQANRVTKIDLRDNPNMTSETVDYTIYTLPISKSSYNDDPNLLLSGSNAEHANTAYATSIDMMWKCDVTGDGTATHEYKAVTLDDATDTGENKTGSLDRLYPHFGMGLDYDLDIYSTTGGKFLLVQWKPTYYQSIESVTGQARSGVPMYVYPYPEEGKRFKSVTVNGKEIFSQWFVIYEPSTIKVNFTDSESSISFTTLPGQALSFLVNTTEANGTVAIDWGSGSRTEYTNQDKYTSGYAEIGGTRIDGSAAGSTVTIYGNVAALDLSGYGDVAEYFGLWDNKVSSIDLSKSSGLKYLNLYWNPISTIDLSNATELEVLDVSFTNLKSIDLSPCPSIMWLDAYSDGYGNEEEGISQLTALDVTGLQYLVHLNSKGNKLSSIDLTKNTYLYDLNLSGNELTAIDLTKNTALESLQLNDNKLTAIDLSQNTELIELSLDRNDLTALDLTNNTALYSLMVSNNKLHSLDLSMLENLGRLWINGNGMTACELNDIYYKLPRRNAALDDNGESGIGQSSWNLAVIQGTDREENDGNRADSSIAVDREWTPSHVGTNGGCDVAYLDILPSPHGFVIVKDAEGNEYGNGSKVPKFATMTIVATPEDGYTLNSFRLGDDEPLTGLEFTMPGIYTKLTPSFVKNSGIDNIDNNGINIFAANGCINVESADEVKVSIFTTTGTIVASGNSSTATFAVPAGVYIVKAGNEIAKVIVK